MKKNENDKQRSVCSIDLTALRKEIDEARMGLTISTYVQMAVLEKIQRDKAILKSLEGK